MATEHRRCFGQQGAHDRKMNVLDLFSGIGGFSLGLERAGMRTIAFCEIDPYCRRVLAKHWPTVPIFGDIRTLTAKVMADNQSGRCRTGRTRRLIGVGEGLREQALSVKVDVICGGFPCQDISVAGKGAGIEGSRSGLWSDYARIIGEVRPRYVIVENVAALLGRGLSRVLGDLAALGFDAEWHCIPASAVGAPHRRDRLWIVAHAVSHQLRDEPRRRDGARRSCQAVTGHDGEEGIVADANARWELQSQGCIGNEWRRTSNSSWWSTEPNVGRVAHGVPARVDRLRSLGNAVVPQITEIIGRAIMNQSTVGADVGGSEFQKQYDEIAKT
jgi:DNA (cytosine-5)-methyltransferase 1